MTSNDQSSQGDYQIRTIRSFDPSSRGIPPKLSPEEALEFAAAHNGLPDEVWQLVDRETGEVIHEYDV